MKSINPKSLFALAFIGMLTFVCNGQNKLDGKWYLQEVQIPSNENFEEGISYDNNACINLMTQSEKRFKDSYGANMLPTEEEIDAFLRDFEEMYEEEFGVADNSDNSEDTPRETCVDIAYQLYNDSVLVLSEREGVYDIYIIKKQAKDILILANDQTLHGHMRLVYGRVKQPIKHTKHNLKRNTELPNPVVNRLSAGELKADKTPAAVAYNFVRAILNSDTDRMLLYMDDEAAMEFEKARLRNDYENYDPFFSGSGEKLNILGWKPYLASNNEVAVLYVQSEWYDEHGREIKKVYVGCVPSKEVGRSRFQDITTYGGTNVKVLLAREGDKWVVVGFK